MLKGLIAKYEPINTVEKGDALIADMQASNISITSSASLEVVMHIKKAKIQMYFRETIQPLLNTKGKVSPIINASTNRVTFNGGYNIEYITSDKPAKKKPKKESKVQGVLSFAEQERLRILEEIKARKEEERRKRKELKQKQKQEQYKREHIFSPQFGRVIKKSDETSKGIFDPNSDDYRKIAEKARSSQVIRNYDGKKSSSVHMMFIPSGGQNKKY